MKINILGFLIFIFTAHNNKFDTCKLLPVRMCIRLHMSEKNIIFLKYWKKSENLNFHHNFNHHRILLSFYLFFINFTADLNQIMRWSIFSKKKIFNFIHHVSGKVIQKSPLIFHPKFCISLYLTYIYLYVRLSIYVWMEKRFCCLIICQPRGLLSMMRWKITHKNSSVGKLIVYFVMKILYNLRSLDLE